MKKETAVLTLGFMTLVAIVLSQTNPNLIEYGSGIIAAFAFLLILKLGVVIDKNRHTSFTEGHSFAIPLLLVYLVALISIILSFMATSESALSKAGSFLTGFLFVIAIGLVLVSRDKLEISVKTEGEPPLYRVAVEVVSDILYLDNEEVRRILRSVRDKGLKGDIDYLNEVCRCDMDNCSKCNPVIWFSLSDPSEFEILASEMMTIKEVTGVEKYGHWPQHHS